MKRRISIMAILVAAFLLNILVLYIYTVITYDLGLVQIRQTAFDSMEAETNVYIEDFERQIEALRLRQSGIFTNKDVRWINIIPDGIMEKYTEIDLKLNVLVNLQQIMNSYDYIDDVSLSFLGRNLKISAISGIDTIPEDERSQMAEYIKSVGSKVFIDNENMILAANSLNFNSSKDSARNAVIGIIKISNAKLSESLKNYTDNNVEKEMVLTTDDGQIIASTFKEAINNEENAILQSLISRKSNLRSEIKISGRKYLVFGAGSTREGLTLYDVIPEEVLLQPIIQYSRWVLLSPLVLIITLIFYSFTVHRLFYKPVIYLKNAFVKVQKGDFNVILKNTVSREYQILFEYFNEMVVQLKFHINQEIKERLLAQEAELKQLQLQINPHFLYNSFFITESMMEEEKYDEARNMARLLAKYFEYITDTSKPDALLQQEVNYATAYAEIQCIRFTRRLRIDFEELPLSLQKLYVPRLILQPIIENAYEHGVKNKSNGLIRLRFHLLPGLVEIDVDDSGDYLTDEKLGFIRNAICDNIGSTHGIALSNIQRRLKLKDGGISGLRADRSELGGLKMTLGIGVDIDDV